MFKKIIKKLRSKNAPRWLVLVIDIYIVVNTFIVAYLIHFNFQVNFDVSKFAIQLPAVVLIALISFLIVGSYKGVIRHTSIRDSINISIANILILSFLGGIVLINRKFNINSNFTIPISILAIHFLLNMTALIASRYLFKELYKTLISSFKEEKRILVYGAGQAGIVTYTILNEDVESNIKIVGFIESNKNRIGKKIQRLNVYDEAIVDKKFIVAKNVNEIIIAEQKLKPLKLIEITDRFANLSVEVKIVPPIKTWIEQELKPQHIKAVNIEDLLGRSPIELDTKILQKEFNNKVILITGAAGSIGSEITRQIAEFNYQQVILIDQAESDLYNLQQHLKVKNKKNIISIVADIRNINRMEAIVKKYQPAIIFHAAAYKHVPLMEKNPNEAVNTNVCGTINMVDLAIQYTVEKFVMISTDKAVNPTNVMGATKRIAELYINCVNKESTTKFITTRFGNVLGSNGSVIPLFKSQIKRGGPLTVTHKDIMRYFMTIPEACLLVLEAGCMGVGGEIFVFDMGDSIKIYDLAVNMIRLSGFKFPSEIDIEITGLRPGEKIQEELLANGENTGETYHEKIMIAKVKQLDVVKVKEQIMELCDLNPEMDYEHTVKKMKEIIPEFISNNSEYQLLDKVVVSEEKSGTEREENSL